MIVLAIDTAASLCAACVYDTQAGERGRAVLDLGKGHAEHLMGVIQEALEASGTAYADLGAVAVSVGPGSFTGVRVGVATARGLALALRVPAIGVSTLEALAAEARGDAPVPVLARIEAGRGQAYVAAFDGAGSASFGPAALATDEADAMIADAGDRLVVTGATADIAVYARLAAAKLASGETDKPKPLYLRDADAKPQGSFALPRKPAP